MIIFPAIDVKDGKCVRLYKGDFNKKTIFNSSPYNQAVEFEKQGFTNLHLVDLDGALKGKSKNKKIIIKIIKKTSLKIQLGGGIRDLNQISFWIKNGIDKVVLGTLAIENYKILETACRLFPGKIAVAIDVRANYLAVKGWVKQTKIKYLNFIKKMDNCGVSRIIFTDIDRDGTKKGINPLRFKKIFRKTKVPIVISGGVANITDIQKLNSLDKAEGVIIGRALYDKDIAIKDLKKKNLI